MTYELENLLRNEAAKHRRTDQVSGWASGDEWKLLNTPGYRCFYAGQTPEQRRKAFRVIIGGKK